MSAPSNRIVANYYYLTKIILTASYTDTTVTNGTTYYYKVTTADTGGNESVKSSISNAATPSAPSGLVGDVGAPATTTLNISGLSSVKNLKVSLSGVVQQSCQLKTLDEKVSLDITEGAKLLDSQGSALDSLSASEATSPSAPPSESAIVCAYDFGPDGATFEPAITLYMSYDSESLPERMTEDELYIAYWDGSQWQGLESTVDAGADTVSAKINHFTQFAVIGKLVSPAAEPAPATFSLSAVSVSPLEVEIGEEVTIGVTVTNAGGQSGSYEATLKVDNAVVDTARVILTAGTSKKVTFTTSRDTAGSYTADINGKTGTFVVKETAPASFSLSAVSVSPLEVEIGEEVTIGVTVTNAGGQSGSYEVTLKIDNAVVDTARITLLADTSKEVTFTTSRDTTGSYTADINGKTGTFVVKELAPAIFSLSAVSVSPLEVEIGEEVTIGVTVTNAGGQSGSYEVTLKVDNAVVDTARIILTAGISKEVTFTTSRDTAGSYTADINGQTGTFVVKETAAVKETTPQLINWWLLGGIIAGCIIFGVAIWQLTTRRRA